MDGYNSDSDDSEYNGDDEQTASTGDGSAFIRDMCIPEDFVVFFSPGDGEGYPKRRRLLFDPFSFLYNGSGGDSSFDFQSDCDWDDLSSYQISIASEKLPSSCFESDHESDSASISSSDRDRDDEHDFVDKNCFPETPAVVNTFTSQTGEMREYQMLGGPHRPVEPINSGDELQVEMRADQSTSESHSDVSVRSRDFVNDFSCRVANVESEGEVSFVDVNSDGTSDGDRGVSESSGSDDFEQ